MWVLPGLVVALTGYTWMDVIGRMRDVLLTAFATGNLFVVLSVLTERIKKLVGQAGENPGRAQHFVEVVVPVAFTFPSVGKLLSLSFVLFAGWISGYQLSASQYPSFALSGLASYFGATVVAIPFLLDLYKIPSDAFQLFLVADNVVGLRFSTMLGAVHMITIALLASAAMDGRIQFRPVKLIRHLVVSVVLLLSVLLGIRYSFEALGHEYEGYNQFIGMQPLRYEGWPKVLDRLPEPASPSELALSASDRAIARGTLRVAYLPDRLPWAFRNEDGRLVGFDVEMAYILAQELGVGVEFVQLTRDELVAALDSGAVDVAMSGIVVTVQSLAKLSFSQSYVDETIAFVVEDHLRDEYGSRAAVQKLSNPVVAIPRTRYYRDKLKRYLPNAVVVSIDSPREFFRAEKGTFDALLYTAESGSAWSLIYPQFTVAVPQPDILKVPLAYAVRHGDDEMARLLSAWIELKHRDRTIETLYAHWILGRASVSRAHRWSVLDDVILAKRDESAGEPEWADDATDPVPAPVPTPAEEASKSPADDGVHVPGGRADDPTSEAADAAGRAADPVEE
jgi:ABC-type amino acid transport substrate-binding protein